MNKSSKVLLALLGGLAAGAVLGMLFAPDKGSETRKKMADAANDLSGKMKEKAKKMAEDFKKKPVDTDDIYS